MDKSKQPGILGKIWIWLRPDFSDNTQNIGGAKNRYRNSQQQAGQGFRSNQPPYASTMNNSNSSATIVIFKKFRAFIAQQGLVGLALMFSFALSIASYYTTLEGLYNFTDKSDGESLSISAFLLAPLISFGIQGILFIASWLVARDMAATSNLQSINRLSSYHDEIDEDRPIRFAFVRNNFGKLFMLGICMFASVFFSFDSLFDRVFKEKERTKVQLSVARSQTTSVLGGLEQSIRDQRALDADKLVQLPAWESFEQRLEAILVVSDGAKEAISASINQKRFRLDAEIGSLTNKVDGLRNKQAEQSTKLKTAEAGLGANGSSVFVDTSFDEERLKEIRIDLAKKESEVGKLTIEMAEEEKGRLQADGTRSKPGRGDRWDELNIEREPLLAARNEIERQARTLSAKIAKAKTTGATSKAKLQSEITKLKGTLANLDQEILTAQAQLDAQRVLLNQLGSAGPASDDKTNDSPKDVSVAVTGAAAIRKAKIEFLATGKGEHFDVMVSGCNLLFEVLIATPVTKPRIGSNNCDASGISEFVEKLRVSDLALTNFQKSCQVDAEFNQLTSVQSFVDLGRECINKTKLPVNIQSRNIDILDKVERENSKETSHFTRTIASLERGDKLAWIALILAISIDSLVFIAAILGARSYSTPTMRAGVVRSMEQHEEVDASNYADLNLYGDEPQDVLNAKVFLSALVSRPLTNGDLIYIAVLGAIEDTSKRNAIRNILHTYGAKVATHLSNDAYQIIRPLILEMTAKVAKFEKSFVQIYGNRDPNAAQKSGVSSLDNWSENGVSQPNNDNGKAESPTKPRDIGNSTGDNHYQDVIDRANKLAGNAAQSDDAEDDVEIVKTKKPGRAKSW